MIQCSKASPKSMPVSGTIEKRKVGVANPIDQGQTWTMLTHSQWIPNPCKNAQRVLRKVSRMKRTRTNLSLKICRVEMKEKKHGRRGGLFCSQLLKASLTCKFLLVPFCWAKKLNGFPLSALAGSEALGPLALGDRGFGKASWCACSATGWASSWQQGSSAGNKHQTRSILNFCRTVASTILLTSIPAFL